MSQVAVRFMLRMGLTQRSISSNAPGSSDGSACNSANWSG
jgi:hypothetical protein